MNIVALHGWGHEKGMFEELKKQLESIPTIDMVETLDLPGFGKRRLINENWDIPQYADWVESEIKKRRLKDVIIIGHSFGGRIAAYIASKKSPYLKAIILSASPVLYRPTTKTKLKSRIFKSVKKIIPSQLKLFAYSDELNDAEKRGLGKVFRKVILFDQTNNLPLIRVPTLLIWGENDIDVPLRNAVEAQTLIKNSKLIVIKDAGHNSYLSHPYIFFGHVKKFIESL